MSMSMRLPDRAHKADVPHCSPDENGRTDVWPAFFHVLRLVQVRNKRGTVLLMEEELISSMIDLPKNLGGAVYNSEQPPPMC